MTDLEKRLLYILAGLVDQNLHEDDKHVFETGFIRIHKTALMELVKHGIMVDADPEGHHDESPFRDYFAKFVPDWEEKLRYA
jgi:hypothetical protein